MEDRDDTNRKTSPTITNKRWAKLHALFVVSSPKANSKARPTKHLRLWVKAVTFSFGGLAATMLAAGIAIALARNDAQRIRNDFEKTAQMLTELAGDMSTRYLGTFPYFTGDIVQLVESRDSRKLSEPMVVACDLPAYAALSSTERAMSLFEQLQTRDRTTSKLHLVVPNAAERRKLLIRMVTGNPESPTSPDPTEWVKLKEAKLADFMEFYKHFVKMPGILDRNEPTTMSPDEFVKGLTFDKYLDLFERVNDKVIQELAAEHLVEINGAMNVFFWIRGDGIAGDGRQRAVFSMPTYRITGDSMKATEHGFRTEDIQLIDALRSICGEYHPSKYYDLCGGTRSLEQLLPGSSANEESPRD